MDSYKCFGHSIPAQKITAKNLGTAVYFYFLSIYIYILKFKYVSIILRIIQKKMEQFLDPLIMKVPKLKNVSSDSGMSEEHVHVCLCLSRFL